MKVVHFQRKPTHIAYSIERIFEDVRRSTASDIDYEVCINQFESSGILPRLYDALRACMRQGDVNHITGDVHYVALFLKKQRALLTVHDCGALEQLHGLRRFLLWLAWYWLPCRRVSRITVVSEFTKRRLLEHLSIDEQRIAVIPNPLSAEFKAYRKTIDVDHPRVLQIGTAPNKNVERVIAALDGLRCTLIIVGTLSPEVRNLLTKSSLRWENFTNLSRDALLDQYIKSDIVMFASTYEGFGMPIVEANAVGRPVIAASVASMPDVARDAACLVDPFNVESIRNAVRRICREEGYSDKLIEAGFRNARRFDLEVIAEAYRSEYRRVYEAAAG